MGSVTIKLSKPLITHEGDLHSLEITEPRGLDYLRLGEPVTYGQNPDGAVFIVENEDVIQRYVEVCVPITVNSIILDQIGLEDAMKIKAAVLDFFRAARDRQSETSSTSSSSTSA